MAEKAITPRGWIVEIQRSAPGFCNTLHFADQIVGDWTEGGSRGNTVIGQAFEQADNVISAFVEEIANQRSRGLGTETAKQGVLL